MTADLSPRGRGRNLRALGTEPVDLLVVGGGIVGSAVAWDAATRGLRTALVERGDFASGTSGKTSRMVHGGLRYLRSGRVGIVREALRERDLLVTNAPALVRPLRFTIPAYAGARPGAFALRLGLFLYDRLSRRRTLPHRAWRGAEDAATDEPALRREGLRGAAHYFDATTNDARLVLAVVRSAADAGALVANHAEVERLVREDGRLVGARIRDRIRDEAHDARASVVVNATGVWIDGLRSQHATATVRPTKGIHVFLPRERVGNREGIVMRARRDGRIMFVLPWGHLALVGTTDTEYEGDWDHVVPDAEDVAYVLESVNDAFPTADVGPEDVVSAYAGLRPLILPRRSPSTESDISRAHAMYEDPDGLISVAGGKLTTMRAMAEEVVDRVCARLGRRASSRTSRASLGPGAGAAAAFRELGLPPTGAAHLGARHPPDAIRPWLDESRGREPILPGLPYVWAEVDAAVEGEMAMTLSDVLVRRLGLFYEAPDQALGIADEVAARLATRLDWNAERVRREIDAYRAYVAEHRRFRGRATR
ncbi:MAG: FAD-dependent oxidoreductase [Methanobacteriota archaeon]